MTVTAADTLTGTWTVDAAHSRVGFTARHAMVTKVRGSFTDFAATAQLNVENPADSHIDVTIEVASVNTGNDQRDGHLRTNDFFDAETYPQIRFVSTNVERLDPENYRLTGDLTIKGITKPVAVDFEFSGVATDPYGNQRAGFEGKATINRKDWGVSFNAALETGGVLVSEKIGLEFDISAIRG
ncbi:MAG TPA: YceI family protein [Sporichthyaceae bacterium]|jgi:polyisoprenoid-binding protein YceI